MFERATKAEQNSELSYTSHCAVPPSESVTVLFQSVTDKKAKCTQCPQASRVSSWPLLNWSTPENEG